MNIVLLSHDYCNFQVLGFFLTAIKVPAPRTKDIHIYIFNELNSL